VVCKSKQNIQQQKYLSIKIEEVELAKVKFHKWNEKPFEFDFRRLFLFVSIGVQIMKKVVRALPGNIILCILQEL